MRRAALQVGATVLIALIIVLAVVLTSGPSKSAAPRASARAAAPTTSTSSSPTSTSSSTSTTASTLPSTTTAPRQTTTSTRAPATTAPSTAPPQHAAVANGGSCGGQPTMTVSGQTWNCTFDDEFNGTALDRTKWTPQVTATSAYHSGEECFVDSPNNISVADGSLDLTVRQEAAPFTCQGFPAYQTQYTSGMVTTWHQFTQAFGVFEIRAKISSATVQGLQTSLWLYPASLKYGPWPMSGEIDIAEMFSQYSNLAIPYVHYNNSDGDPAATNDNCVIGDPSQWHTYEVQWTPWALTFIYDGTTCLTDQWRPIIPQSAPEPFDQPFMISLTQALGINTNQFEPGITPLPATTSIDWVRVWGSPSQVSNG
jgi:beta-glucanase (GH16 family)